VLLTNAILSDTDDFRIPQPRGGVSEPAPRKTFRIKINLDRVPLFRLTRRDYVTRRFHRWKATLDRWRYLLQTNQTLNKNENPPYICSQLAHRNLS
jgi:hypothetical protein